MRRSTDFGATVKYGQRAAQRDIVVHARRAGNRTPGPKVGLIVTRAVGSSVQRHRVARRLRHAARNILGELEPQEHMVIRALPGSSQTKSVGLEQQLRAGLQRIHRPRGGER
jgi:ribonuclease P protein component